MKGRKKERKRRKEKKKEKNNHHQQNISMEDDLRTWENDNIQWVNEKSKTKNGCMSFLFSLCLSCCVCIQNMHKDSIINTAFFLSYPWKSNRILHVIVELSLASITLTDQKWVILKCL